MAVRRVYRAQSRLRGIAEDNKPRAVTRALKQELPGQVSIIVYLDF